jgi:hypothetical protein
MCSPREPLVATTDAELGLWINNLVDSYDDCLIRMEQIRGIIRQNEQLATADQ